MPFLFAHRRHRAVPGAKDGFVRQGENLFKIVAHRILVRHVTATHRPGEKRVAHDRDRLGQSSNDESHSPRRMSPGEARFNFQLPDSESPPFFDCSRAAGVLPTRQVNRRAGRVGEPVQIGNVIGMGVRKQDELDRQPAILAVFEHRRAIRAAVKGDRLLARRIPDEIGIHRYVVK